MVAIFFFSLMMLPLISNCVCVYYPPNCWARPRQLREIVSFNNKLKAVNTFLCFSTQKMKLITQCEFTYSQLIVRYITEYQTLNINRSESWWLRQFLAFDTKQCSDAQMWKTIPAEAKKNVMWPFNVFTHLLCKKEQPHILCYSL